MFIYKIKNYKIKNFKRLGFTIFELLIVIGITATLSVVSVGFYVNQQKAKLLELTAQEIASYLKYTQQKSVSQEQGLQWGVHFDNPSSGSDFYALYTFYDTCATSSLPIETRYLPAGIIFTTPATGNSVNVSFNKLTGTNCSETNQSLVIQSISSSATKTISVSIQGLITY